MVIYPDGVWYHYETFADIDEILEAHVGHGKVVPRLLMPDATSLVDVDEASTNHG